ncbi:hypothetical protein BGX33_006839 [Mortierella sp. NVP41]|nr:hypothetical protein BGX33_006839 [Mortierella sp. NVP41]
MIEPSPFRLLVVQSAVPFGYWSWIVVTFTWVLYVLATGLMSRGVIAGYLDGSGAGAREEQQQQHQRQRQQEQEVSNEEEVPTFKKEEKGQEQEEQDSDRRIVDTEDLSDIGYDTDTNTNTDMDNRAHLCDLKTSTQILRRSTSSYRRNGDHPCRGESDAITVKRHHHHQRSRQQLSAAHKKTTTWTTTSISLLQQVKHEIQIWSFSLWVLAPTIPRSLHHGHNHQHYRHRQQQYGAATDVQEEGGRSRLRLPLAKGLLLVEDADESEYDLVESDDAVGFLDAKGVLVALKKPGYDGHPRRDQKEDEGEQEDQSQDDGMTGGHQSIPSAENRLLFAQPHHRHQTGLLSQSMPDLHSAKRTGPRGGVGPVESTLSRWSRMTLDPERLGSIFQYYLRQHASTLKKERKTEGDIDIQDPQCRDVQNDRSSDNEDNNDDVNSGPGVTFVIRSSTLPTVRVGLYGADQKRLWSSTGPIHEELLDSPE